MAFCFLSQFPCFDTLALAAAIVLSPLMSSLSVNLLVSSRAAAVVDNLIRLCYLFVFSPVFCTWVVRFVRS